MLYSFFLFKKFLRWMQIPLSGKTLKCVAKFASKSDLHKTFDKIFLHNILLVTGLRAVHAQL
jgi:hypothetical protein